MGAGKVLAIIGGVVGALSVLLYYIMPELFSLWKLDVGLNLTIYIGGFGAWSGEFITIPFGPEYSGDVILMLVSVLILGGSVLTFIAGLAGSKAIGILGGIILLAGPILLLVSLVAQMGFFGQTIIPLLGNENLLFGSVLGVAEWGINIGFYLAIGGGLLGIIGGATI